MYVIVDTGCVENNQKFLPILVRLSSLSSINSDKEELWDGFRKYLVSEAQRKHSVRNQVGYARRFYYILETKNA